MTDCNTWKLKIEIGSIRRSPRVYLRAQYLGPYFFLFSLMTYLKLFSTPKCFFLLTISNYRKMKILKTHTGSKKDLHSILRWSYENNISFNLSKYQYINFNIKSRLSPVSGQWLLEQSRTVENHGITMKDSLT